MCVDKRHTLLRGGLPSLSFVSFFFNDTNKAINFQPPVKKRSGLTQSDYIGLRDRSQASLSGGKKNKGDRTIQKKKKAKKDDI